MHSVSSTRLRMLEHIFVSHSRSRSGEGLSNPNERAMKSFMAGKRVSDSSGSSSFNGSLSQMKILIMICILHTCWSPLAIAFCPPNRHGAISIDCGGEGHVDPNTTFEYVVDEDCLDLASVLRSSGVSIPASVTLSNETTASRDNPLAMETAMAFLPSADSPSKYCYVLSVNATTNYLLRAMFPSSQLRPRLSVHQGVSLSGRSTRFYFTVDTTFVKTVELKPSDSETIELMVVPLDESMYVCLVPLEDRSSMPAISSLELRPLSEDLYQRNRSESTVSSRYSEVRQNSGLRTTYLLTVYRLDFGADASRPAIRYPIDNYDRMWYPRGGNSSNYTSMSTTSFAFDNYYSSYQYPKEVDRSAWVGIGNSTISIELDISGVRASRPIPTFYFSFTFMDVDPESQGGGEMEVYLEYKGDAKSKFLRAPASAIPTNETWAWRSYREQFDGDVPIFSLERTVNSTRPVVINTLELMGEFEAETARTLPKDASTITDFSKSFQNPLDTTGDPCLPVPWNWIVCSIEMPPRITQINVTGRDVGGKIPQIFGTLDMLTTLDLSNNTFHGSLPASLANVSTLRQLNLADNQLSGDLPMFQNQSLVNLESISLRNNKFKGSLASLFNALRGSSVIRNIDISHNGFNHTVPRTIETSGWRVLEVLDVSSNLLRGSLPVELVNITELKILKIQDNQLTGSVPKEIWAPESKLQLVNLSNNKFRELDLFTWCDAVLSEKSLTAFRQKVYLLNNSIRDIKEDCFDWLPRPIDFNPWLRGAKGFILLGGNPWCNGESSLARRYFCRFNPNENFWSEDKSGLSWKLVVIGVVVGGCILMLMGCVLALVLRRMWKRTKELRQIQEVLAKEDVRPPFFKYEDLKSATRDFSSENELGRGAFGAVYKGVLADESIVAVKLLFGTDQIMEDFLKEVVLITGIKHRHLIQLKGCCVRDRKRILVYEYAENKNLANALWVPTENRTSRLTWAQRLSICVGVARGLCYLHEELQPRIIHRDIKAQNILLDKNWNAKIADFGLARYGAQDDSTQLATRIGGTLGYFSPEYATQGRLTEKLDVYSYGVLVLEIIAGRKCIDNSLVQNPHEIYLKDWVFRMFSEGKLLSVAEKGLLTEGSAEKIESVLTIALACLNENPDHRPSMSEVVHKLSGSSFEDIAVDIVGQLREQERLYGELFPQADATPPHYSKDHSVERSLLQTSLLRCGSSSDPHHLVELSAIPSPR